VSVTEIFGTIAAAICVAGTLMQWCKPAMAVVITMLLFVSTMAGWLVWQQSQ
jgi:hypothetical protein